MMGRLFSATPLLIIPVAIYNIIVAARSAFSSVEAMQLQLSTEILNLPMTSGASWSVSQGDVIIFISLIFLFFELIKSTGVGRIAILNHAFSMILFIICLVEFLLLNAFATSVFFLIMVMCLLDVTAGFIITIASARRDFAVGDGIAS